MIPKPLPVAPLNCGVLKALNISIRNWTRAPSPRKLDVNHFGVKFLYSEKSTFLTGGPEQTPRPAFPFSPILIPTRVKAAGLTKASGPPPETEHGTPDTRFGR